MFDSPRPKHLLCSASMAIGAYYIAFFNFFKNGCDCRACRNIALLCLWVSMIELQNHDIIFSTVHALFIVECLRDCFYYFLTDSPVTEYFLAITFVLSPKR